MVRGLPALFAAASIWTGAEVLILSSVYNRSRSRINGFSAFAASDRPVLLQLLGLSLLVLYSNSPFSSTRTETDRTVRVRRLGELLFVCGSLSNLTQRVLLGGVVDYIDLRMDVWWIGKMGAYSLNLSDIMVSVALLLEFLSIMV